MQTHFFLYLTLELLEVGEYFTLPIHWKDPLVVRIIIDKGDVISASSDCPRLSHFLYIQVDYIKEAFRYKAFLW
mgnify:CR=1 FL=1